jgi:hypothetical protein
MTATSANIMAALSEETISRLIGIPAFEIPAAHHDRRYNRQIRVFSHTHGCID